MIAGIISEHEYRNISMNNINCSKLSFKIKHQLDLLCAQSQSAKRIFSKWYDISFTRHWIYIATCTLHLGCNTIQRNDKKITFYSLTDILNFLICISCYSRHTLPTLFAFQPTFKIRQCSSLSIFWSKMIILCTCST